MWLIPEKVRGRQGKKAEAGVSARKEERTEAWGLVSVDRGSRKVHQEHRAGPGRRDISESDGGENPERMSKGTRVLLSGWGDGEPLGISWQSTG